MDTPENRDNEICPYFLQDMKACGLHTDGIYLPPRPHVLTYCLSSFYRNCSTYERYCLSEKLHQIQTDQSLAGRRRFLRIARQRNVLIRTCDPIGVVSGDFAEKATTVDYSQGGMRIVMEKEIPDDSLVLFDFDNDFLIPCLQGIARLCWSRRDEAGRGFEAGLSFKDQFSQAVLAIELTQ
ncbi:MAG: PilZ domain-containing protein [Desulfobacterales bacterium]|nr:PilZ domain-containing protein [Desulfobacterales bacterium]